MPTALTDPLSGITIQSEPPPLDPMQRHGQIEVDTFCTQCFYNLHGQIVTIDPRLNFPVCRCPECGRFHPAGAGVTASSVWMRRLATMLLFSWALTVLLGTLGLGTGYFALGITSVEAFTYGESIPVGHNAWRYQMHIRPWQNPGNIDNNINGIDSMIWISIGSILVGFLHGLLCVTLLWHWRRTRYFWILLLPVLVGGALTLIYHDLSNYDGIRFDCVDHVLCQTAMQIVGVVAGILLGRKISRTILRTIIPPKPLQTLAFLWTIDGRKPPTA